jgi:predicted nucleic acid-binding Zn ribbon protein
MERNKEEKPLKVLVDKMLRAYGLSDKLDEVELIESWEKIVGKMISKHTKDIFFKNKVLYLELDSSALKHELNLAKSKLRDKLNSDIGKNLVNEIVIK